MAVHTLKKFRAFDVLSTHIIERYKRSDISVIGYANHEIRLNLCLPPLHFALVGIVVAVLVTYAPVVAWEGKEISRIVKTVLVLRENMRSAHSEHIESHGGDIAEETHIRRCSSVSLRSVR